MEIVLTSVFVLSLILQGGSMFEILVAMFGIVIPVMCIGLSYMMEDRPRPIRIRKEAPISEGDRPHLKII